MMSPKARSFKVLDPSRNRPIISSIMKTTIIQIIFHLFLKWKGRFSNERGEEAPRPPSEKGEQNKSRFFADAQNGLPLTQPSPARGEGLYYSC
jgi:hypothetical protein